MTALEVLKIIQDRFMNSNYPLKFIILDPKDMDYTVGDLINETIEKEDRL